MKKALLFLFTFIAICLNAQNIIKPINITQDMGSDCGDDGGGCGFGIVRENLINGTGLSAEPTLATELGATTHSRALGDCWATNDESGTAYFDDFGSIRFVFDLGGTSDVTDVVLWGYGYFFGDPVEPSTNDPKDMTIEFSNNGGTTFGSAQNIVAPSAPGSGGKSIVIPVTTTTADHVRVTITSNYGGGRVGLGEIRFVGSTLLGIDDFNISQIKLYPNPASNFIEVSNIREKINLKIFNVIGEELKNLVLTNSSEKIDVANFDTGLYFIKINSSSRVLKFIKK